MKTRIKNLFLLPALLAGFALIPAGRVTAQTFTNLHNFTGVSDGANPYPGMILSSNKLYGTTSGGGSAGNGAVFAVNTDGTGFTNLHSFAFSEGINPFAGLLISGNTLYGTASQGGSSGNGTVFAINTDGTGFTNLHNFTGGSDGANPFAGLVISGNTLYGTATGGGSAGNGDVFAINTNGTGFTNLYSFTGGNDGASPYAVLTLSGNTLYGTANQGGSAGDGDVFALTTTGTGFTNLHSFTGASDGANPNVGLILSANTLYGTTSHGGGAGDGTVFAVNTNGGTGFTNLHNFTGVSDGANPNAVILSDNILYGTTSHGGSAGDGTVFAVSTNGGAGFTNLHSFTGSSDGTLPHAGLIISGNILYGTASGGGRGGDGTVFALNLNGSTSTPPNPIPLEIESAGSAVVLTWTNSAFSLQSAPAVTGTFTNLPGATSRYTNPITGTQRFFRLSQ